MGKLRKMFEEPGAALSCHDVEARLFVDIRNGREYIKILYAERFVYIKEYRRDSPHGLATPVYALRTDEDQRDAERPRPMTMAEKRRLQRARPEVREAEKRAARIRRKRAAFLAEGVKLDPLMAALNRDAIIPRP